MERRPKNRARKSAKPASLTHLATPTARRTQVDAREASRALAQAARPSVSEWDLWASIWYGNRWTFPETAPTPAAVTCVFTRALLPDFESADPVELLDELHEHSPSSGDVLDHARTMVDVASEGSATPSCAVSIAATILGRSPCLWIGPILTSEFEPTAGHRLIETLNRYPSSDALAAWYLAPVVRMICSPGPGPEWLFRFLALMHRARRSRPWLTPRGAPETAQWSAPPDYGWESLENWVLRVWLREPVTYQKTDKRLEVAVQYAVRSLKQLTRLAPTLGPVALDFEELCRPLRRCLHWYASVSRNDPERRKTAQRQLRELAKAVVPALPPREPVVLEFSHGLAFQQFRELVSEVWESTRAKDTTGLRRRELEQRHGNLGPLAPTVERAAGPMTRRLLQAQRGFWKDCGDLALVEPSHVARCFVKHFMGVELEPRRIKELLATLDEEPPYQRRSIVLGRTAWSDRSIPPLG